jgi:hypothetical protein
MLKRWMAPSVLAVCAGVLTLATLQAQRGGSSGATKVPALTAMDYIEIQQLVARYSFALDTGADNGYMYAHLYTSDGVFNNSKGLDQLAALARGGRRGPFNVRNLSSNAIIKASPEGARGIQYAQAINFGENRKPTELDHFGHYEDVYVKTADGWRYKSRTFVNESHSLPPQSATSRDAAPAPSRSRYGASGGPGIATLAAAHALQRGANARALTALDRIEIQQLVAQANYAIQTGADDGYLYARLFTADGAVDNVVGREQLAMLARGGRSGTRSLSTNVLIEPSIDGATGKQYEVVIKFGDATTPVTLGPTGRYEDIYARTPDGWRFKRREFIASIPTSEAAKAIVRATPPAPGQPPPPPVPAAVPLQPPQRGSGISTLTAMDYLEIQQLVASYGHALDGGLGRLDGGEAYAGLFAPDGVFGRPYTTGHDALV